MIIRFDYQERIKPFEIYIDATKTGVQINVNVFPVKEIFISHVQPQDETGLIFEEAARRLKGAVEVAPIAKIQILDERSKRVLVTFETNVKDIYYRNFLYRGAEGLVNQESVSIRLYTGTKPTLDAQHDIIVCSPDCPYLENGFCKNTYEDLNEAHGFLLATTTCCLENDVGFRRSHLRESYDNAFRKVNGGIFVHDDDQEG